MKKVVKKIALLLIVFGIGVGVTLYTNNKYKVYDEEEPKQIMKHVDTISMMIETEAKSGNYEMTTRSEWPTEGYVFNSELSKCENGGELSWDDTNKRVVMSGNVSDKCYVYFDFSIITFSFEDIQYKAKSGMTLSEWRDSNFNTFGYYFNSLYDNVNINTIINQDDSYYLEPITLRKTNVNYIASIDKLTEKNINYYKNNGFVFTSNFSKNYVKLMYDFNEKNIINAFKDFDNSEILGYLEYSDNSYFVPFSPYVIYFDVETGVKNEEGLYQADVFWDDINSYKDYQIAFLIYDDEGNWQIIDCNEDALDESNKIIHIYFNGANISNSQNDGMDVGFISFLVRKK